MIGTQQSSLQPNVRRAGRTELPPTRPRAIGGAVDGGGVSPWRPPSTREPQGAAPSAATVLLPNVPRTCARACATPSVQRAFNTPVVPAGPTTVRSAMPSPVRPGYTTVPDTRKSLAHRTSCKVSRFPAAISNVPPRNPDDFPVLFEAVRAIRSGQPRAEQRRCLCVVA